MTPKKASDREGRNLNEVLEHLKGSANPEEERYWLNRIANNTKINAIRGALQALTGADFLPDDDGKLSFTVIKDRNGPQIEQAVNLAVKNVTTALRGKVTVKVTPYAHGKGGTVVTVDPADPGILRRLADHVPTGKASPGASL